MEKLTLTMKPFWDDDTVTKVEIEASYPSAGLPEEAPELNYCAEGFGGLCPFPDMTGLKIRDEKGEIPFEIRDTGVFYTGIEGKGLFFERKPEGILRWSYTIYPRILPEGYRSSPYYDFRNEPLGLTGSGAFSFILPQNYVRFLFSLKWDMSMMPEDARTVWSYGSGNVERELDAWSARFTFYGVGQMHAVEDGEFGIYWFSEPEFEVGPTTERLTELFRYMKVFFKDKEPMYKIFLRRDPFKISGGGSGAGRAFISGYSAFGGMDVKRWFNNLAHEMVHNWPCMDMAVPGYGAWYSEGTAEYFSTVLPYRAGIVDKTETLRIINQKANERYYTNIYREVPNKELPEIEWKDRRAQTVIYGRGFMYLANLETKLKKAGLGSIDEIAPVYSWDNPMREEDWIRFLHEKFDAIDGAKEALADFENMKSGKLVVPEEGVFGEEFRIVKDVICLEEKEVKSYHWELAQ